jgi:hypothetical protein
MCEVALDNREELSAALAAYGPDTSDLNFTNLHIWKSKYGFRVAKAGEAICLFALRPDPEDSFILPPLAGNVETVRQCLGILEDLGHDPKLAHASRADLDRCGVTDTDFEIAEDRDNSDYVYSVRDLIELSGNRYHSKKNHIAQFMSKHDFEYRRLTPDLVPECLELQDRWCDEKHCDLVASLLAEHAAIREVLGNMATLGVIGGAILIDGRVEAFTIGELLNPETLVIHIEKANGNFHGLYQAINQQFLEHSGPTPPSSTASRTSAFRACGRRRSRTVPCEWWTSTW